MLYEMLVKQFFRVFELFKLHFGLKMVQSQQLKYWNRFLVIKVYTFLVPTTYTTYYLKEAHQCVRSRQEIFQYFRVILFRVIFHSDSHFKHSIILGFHQLIL